MSDTSELFSSVCLSADTTGLEELTVVDDAAARLLPSERVDVLLGCFCRTFTAFLDALRLERERSSSTVATLGVFDFFLLCRLLKEERELKEMEEVADENTEAFFLASRFELAFSFPGTACDVQCERPPWGEFFLENVLDKEVESTLSSFCIRFRRRFFFFFGSCAMEDDKDDVVEVEKTEFFFRSIVGSVKVRISAFGVKPMDGDTGLHDGKSGMGESGCKGESGNPAGGEEMTREGREWGGAMESVEAAERRISLEEERDNECSEKVIFLIVD